MLLKKFIATCLVAFSILIVALAVGYLVDVYLYHMPWLFAPLPTAAITILVGMPVGFIVISQYLDAQLSRRRLAETVAEKDAAAAEIQSRREEAEKARAAAEEALEQLKDSEGRYRMLAERATDIIVRYDIGGTIEYVSPAIRQFGYAPEALIGRNSIEFLHPEDQPYVAERRSRLVRGSPVTTQHRARFRRADGEWAWAEGVPALIRNDGGVVVGAVTVLRDVTERIAMEDELRRQQAAADASNIAKAEFIANMSHEIRTPLTGVIGFASLLERMDDLPDRARRYVDRIIKGGQALLAIVNDVLDFSRLDAGQIELDPQPFQVECLLKDTLDLVAADARSKGLELSTDFEGALPALVLADSGRVRQVLLNLLSNAIKFTAAGAVRLAVGYDASQAMLRFTVADTGPGISADQVGRLFQRFSQIDSSNTRQHGGAGLGLAISRGLTEMMGGKIGVQSQEGEGSTFWFTVAAPAVDTYGPDPILDPEDWRLAPMRILVVDDVAANRELVETLLAPYDLQLTEAENGIEAVEAALHNRFDLILMDLQMPGMDGLAATRAIRANSEFNRRTPILAVSANVLPVHVEACRQAGMNDHIGKPINPHELLGKIDRWTAAAA